MSEIDLELAKKKAIAAMKKRDGKSITPFEEVLCEAGTKVFEAGWEAALKAMRK
jgi:hypothetical protein